MEQPTQFEGWAIVELFGHQREIGYVKTRYFGTACLFQVDVPELPERDVVLAQPQYVDGKWAPSGASVRKKAAPARSRMVGPGAIYALNPCTEEVAMRAIEMFSGREIVLLEMPKQSLKLIGETVEKPQPCAECGAASEDEHDPTCSFFGDDEDEGDK
jgi:hypothetical protein